MPGTLSEREGAVTMKGNPLTLLGEELKVGQTIPEATLVANDLSEVSLSSFKGKKCIISVVPSLDTEICDLQTKRFNEEAVNLGDDVAVLTVSVDLPFAQKRWCAASEANNVQTLSAYRDVSFGEAFGVLVKGLRLFARAVFVTDAQRTVQYAQIVPEVTHEPDYDAALEAVKNL